MVDKDSNIPKDLKKEGDKYLKEGDYKKAIQYYKKAIELDPQYIKAWHNLGYSFIKLGQKKDAVRCYQRIKELRAFLEDPPIQNLSNRKKSHVTIPKDEKLQYHGSGVEIQQPINTDTKPNTPIQNTTDNGVLEKLPQVPDHGEQPVIIPIEIQQKSSFFDKNLIYKDSSDEGDEKESQFTTYSDFFKKAIYISIIIGFCLMVSLLILGSTSERYTQFYLYPDSIQTINDTSSFIYGVKSFEHETTQYHLLIYIGSELVDAEVFTLDPGETRKERKSFEYIGLIAGQPKKIDVILKSSYQTYDLHYWIQK